jgi:hypothetical protein
VILIVIMQTAALIISAFGHACWDNILVWMVDKDPDASMLHMHWIRSSIIFSFLYIFGKMTKSTQRPKKSLSWWLKFAITGWSLPGIVYSLSVMYTGYRFSLTFQPFVPLFIAIFTGAPFNERRSAALTCAMIASMCILVSFKTYELWMIWGSIIASIIHISCLVCWFSMLAELKTNQIGAITSGAFFGVVILFFSMIIWTPQHLETAFMSNPTDWLAILFISAIAAACKYLVIAQLSNNMPADAVAIFECIHPIATLCCDIARGSDQFEWYDSFSIIFLAISWILYPKMNIKRTFSPLNVE